MINLFITGSKPKVQLVDHPEAVRFIYIDLFCGAGGTTTGLSNATINGKKIAIIAACVNHDPKALESHWKNHPEVVHFEEDIRTLELSPLVELINEYRRVYPRAKIVLWASLECTNFSKAKGGQPRDGDSRTLPESLISIYDPRTKRYHKGESYVQMIQPDYIQIENVVEFMSWGPMRIVANKSHKQDLSKGVYAHTELKFIFNKKTQQEEYAWTPISKKNGVDFRRWVKSIESLGYRSEWRELNSADFGAYTSRNRLFGCFAKEGLPIAWPEPTHQKQKNRDLADRIKRNMKKPSLHVMQKSLFGDGGGKLPWKAVKDVLDFDDEGISIFGRKKGLSPRTLERIYAGLIKYVAGGKDAFLSTYNSGKPDSRNTSVDNPCRSVLTANTHAKVQCSFLQKYYSGRPEGKVIPVTGPAGTITTVGGQTLVQPLFLVNYNHSSECADIENACPTLLTRDRLALVNTAFLSKYYGNGDNVQSVNEPAGALTTKDRFCKAHVVWLDKTYNGPFNHQDINRPAGSVLTNDKHQKVHAICIDRNFKGGAKLDNVYAKPFILNPNYGNIGNDINEPAPPLLASRRHYYIVNPSHGGHTMSTDVPCPVIVARQDKAPLYLMRVDNTPMMIFEAGNFLDYQDWHYFKNGKGEPSIRAKIVEFMFMYNISDIKMRMLKISELLPIQGFPSDYVLVGNQSDQKKFIGNSVHPLVPEAWIVTLGLKLDRAA